MGIKIVKSINDSIKNIKREQIINGLMHVILSIFAGTWVVAFSVPFDEGMHIVQHMASVAVSSIVVGKAIISIGFSWLVARALRYKLPMKPVKLYWLYVVALWIFTYTNII